MSDNFTTKIDSNLVGIWTCPVATHDRGDWLGTATDNHDGTFAIRTRFRNGKTDDKSWLTAKFTGTRDGVIEAIRSVAKVVSDMHGNTVEELLMGSNGVNEFMAELAKKQWFQK